MCLDDIVHFTLSSIVVVRDAAIRSSLSQKFEARLFLRNVIMPRRLLCRNEITMTIDIL